MRYVVKFNNGFWKSFDMHNYTDVSLHYLRKDANAFVQNLNHKAAQ